MNRWISYTATAIVVGSGAVALQNTPFRDLTGFSMAHAQTAEATEEAAPEAMEEAATEEAAPEQMEEAAEPEAPVVIDMTLGADDAPVTVIEYASFTCPHCRSFHENTFEQVKENYIDTGKVQFIYREVYFDRFGLWAGMIARCGGGEKYFGIADMIYEQQQTWTGGENPGAIADNLARIGKTAGLTGAEIDACLQDGDMAQAMVAAYQENAERDQIRSTPSFIVNGELISGDQSYDAFSAILDAKLDD